MSDVQHKRCAYIHTYITYSVQRSSVVIVVSVRAHAGPRATGSELPKLKQEHARHYMTGAPDPRHDRDRTPRGPTGGTTTCIVQRARGTPAHSHTGLRTSRHRRGVMGGGCELYISKVLTAPLRHHDTPRHLRRGELLQSQKMVQKVEGWATMNRGHVFRGHLCYHFSW